MVRLFLKLYGVLIATLALSFVVQMHLMDYVWAQLSAGLDLRAARFRPTFHLIDEALVALPDGQRSARLAQLATGFGVPARLETLAEARAGLAPEQAAALAAGEIVSVDLDTGGFRLVRRLRDGGGAVRLDYPGIKAREARMLTYAVNWAVEFAILAVLVFFWVRPFWRDLRRLQAAAAALGEGRFEARAEVGRFSALRPFAEAFDAMAGRLAGLVQSHRTLTSGVAHELRTPLARLRFSHSLAREEPSAVGKDRYLARIERDIAQVDALTTELLDYARLERGVPVIRQERIPAGPWLEDVLADAREEAGRRPGNLGLRVRADLESLCCEPRYMARAVDNLVRNAMRHARSTIEVSLARDGPRTVIHVDDDGPGIPGPERERLFEPFVRLDGSRARDSGGFGLGLAIVRQVARWHGGEAVLGPSPLGGARASIAW